MVKKQNINLTMIVLKNYFIFLKLIKFLLLLSVTDIYESKS